VEKPMYLQFDVIDLLYVLAKLKIFDKEKVGEGTKDQTSQEGHYALIKPTPAFRPAHYTLM
jgi:hypothetical protein